MLEAEKEETRQWVVTGFPVTSSNDDLVLGPSPAASTTTAFSSVKSVGLPGTILSALLVGRITPHVPVHRLREQWSVCPGTPSSF